MNRRGQLYKSCKRKARKTRERFDRRPVAHFLHVGKTAGTALRFTLHDVRRSTRYRMVLHGHKARLERVPEGEKFFFCVRDPVDRYVSAFLSRQREGRPRFYVPWSEDEALAFSHFESPEDLALALSAPDELHRSRAEEAMRSIRHLSNSYWDWFRDPEYFTRRSDDLLWIGRQGSLDIAGLGHALGVEGLTLPEDATTANRATSPKPELSDVARQNLNEWYADDYAFLSLCDEMFPADTRR